MVEGEAMSEAAGDPTEISTIDRRSARGERVEVITGRERRRTWTTEQKLQIVGESLEAGASPIAVARRHGIGSGLLYTWRQQLLRGELGAVAPQPTPRFARVDVLPAVARAEMPAAAAPEPEGAAAPLDGGASAASLGQPEDRIEIVLSSGVVVRVGAAVNQRALCRVLAVLAGR
jgi:transposase